MRLPFQSRTNSIRDERQHRVGEIPAPGPGAGSAHSSHTLPLHGLDSTPVPYPHRTLTVQAAYGKGKNPKKEGNCLPEQPHRAERKPTSSTGPGCEQAVHVYSVLPPSAWSCLFQESPNPGVTVTVTKDPANTIGF